MAQWLARERGQTISQRLAEIYDKYGHFVSQADGHPSVLGCSH